ncbi:hypothetical protein Tco_0869842, partial [Tanacetum coccineum]
MQMIRHSSRLFLIDKDVVGNDMTTAEQLIRFIKNQLAAAQICAEVSCVQVKTQADWMLLYVVPTGRVVVPTGRYVVPAGKVIIIVSPGRLNLVPTGRILSPGKAVKIYLKWDPTTVNELHAMLKLHEETLPKKDANPALHAIQARR